MASINDVFDASAAERFAFEARLAPQLFWLLIGMAMISMAALGYQLGLKGQKTYILSGLLVAVWTAVIVVILD
jgi:TPP-dependent 2-oxoacid decarboxylase